uniref:Uncharacterized protein n=1 Tax=Anopheles culicifacies TaxID=139723 RepID=A0A182MGI5_9DIPT
MDNLLELQLSWNKLEFIQLSSYQFPKQLTQLDISFNRLHQLDLSLVPVQSLMINADRNFISTFDMNSTSPNVSALRLTRNPIDCSWNTPQERNHTQCKQTLDFSS